MTLQIETTSEIDATAASAWNVFGEGFGEWADWADGITSSKLDGPVKQGAIRTNDAVGFGILTQELTRFDRQARELTYEIRTGMPAVIKGARNRWIIEDTGDGRSRITGNATFELAWWALPLSPLLRRKMTGSLESFTAEFAAHAGRA